MIYVYRRSPSAGARALAQALGGRRWRHRPPRLQEGDKVVCWGETAPATDQGVDVINGAPLRNKLEDIWALNAAGVPTVTTVQRREEIPAVAAARPQNPHIGAVINADEAWTRRLVAELQAWLEAPLPVMAQPEWLGRLYSHRGGNDLLSPPASPDYWVNKEDIIREFRVHSFRGESIRAGVKIPRATALEPVHPWIRSWDGGWRISYDGRTTQQRHRLLAASAVAALGLQFGAVDIGERPDGTSIVLEVNRAPGLEGGTIEAYALAVKQWIERD